MTAGTMRDLMHAIYDRITVVGPVIVGVRLTQAAHAHGLARWRCPERLKWRARQDSNLRPLGPEPNALSTELQARERQGYRSPRTGADVDTKAEAGSRRSRPRSCPGEGVRRNGHFCHASRASITSAAPTTLTLPTHDLAAGAALTEQH